MAGNTTVRLLGALKKIAPKTRFLTGLFQSPAENFYDGQ